MEKLLASQCNDSFPSYVGNIKEASIKLCLDCSNASFKSGDHSIGVLSFFLAPLIRYVKSARANKSSKGSSSSKTCQSSSGLAWAGCWVLAPLKSVSHLDGCPANGSKSTLVHSHLPLQDQRAKCLFVLSSVA
ncbi:hypothetical protein AVEN_224719-1 [Araneus ventricosus]|uniref:Uncharacterized protein n=1 Tax=Araneus ventricosus TaxID=182803 RepID=A0A4Y2U4Z4_ARAVE|nr:hypothetical protein AVEN_224719-1 [Araneus ventricosus]